MIVAHDVSFSYNGTAAVSEVSISTEPGEFLAIVGANGAGKTTFIKLLAGIYRPDAGSIDVDGIVGFCPEDAKAGLFAESVADEVAFFPRNRGLDVRDRAESAMETMDVLRFRDRDPHSLSVGEQRRVAIASVLSGDPDVVVLDEPTGGLARKDERRLGHLLGSLGCTIVVSTHQTDFAYEFADRIAVMHRGRLRRVGEPVEILTDDELLAEVAVRVPGLVEWARRQGFDRPPADFDEAIEMARRKR